MRLLIDHFDALLGTVGVLGGAGFSALAVVLVAIIGRRQRETDRRINAVVTATTVNHHDSNPPTLVDRIDTVQQSISGLAATVEAHHEEQQRRNDQQDERLARGMVEFARLDRTIRHYHPEAGS